MSSSRWCGNRACALRRHGWRPLLRLCRAFAIGASHLLARLQDHLLHALLAHPFDDVFRNDELTSIEAGRGLAIDLGRDVVGDGAVRRGGFGGDRRATLLVAQPPAIRRDDLALGDGATLREPELATDAAANRRASRPTHEGAGDSAKQGPPTGRRLLVIVVTVHLIGEPLVKDVAPTGNRLVAQPLPALPGAHRLGARRGGRQCGVAGLVAGLSGTGHRRLYLAGIAAAYVDRFRA